MLLGCKKFLYLYINSSILIMELGLVSIITSSYNSSEFIGKTIESIQSQTYVNWELLITDDCSSDNSCSVIQRYIEKDSRIKLFMLKKNNGPGISRNNSIHNAKGQYIAFCDSDDSWAPNKLELQLVEIKKRDCAMVFSSYYICDENSVVTSIISCKKRIRYWRIVCDNAIGFLTMMFDREKLGTQFLPEIRKRQDWGLNIKLLRKCRIAYGIKTPLAYYRIRKGSVSYNKISLIKYNISIYRDILGFSRIGSVLMFCFLFLPFYFGKKFLNNIRSFTR